MSGLLVCPNCKLKLGNRFKINNHYIGRCTEHNWKKIGKKYDISQCPLKKSPRMEELDKKVLSVVIELLKKSSLMKEDYKKKFLNPKFEEEGKLKKQKDSIQKSIRTKQRELKMVEEESVKLQFEVRLGKTSKNIGKSLTEKFENHIETLEEEIQELKSHLDVIKKSKGWVDWIESMILDLDNVRNYSLEKRGSFFSIF